MVLRIWWKRCFSSSGGFGCNVIIFGVDISSSVHFDHKKIYILILGEGPMQGLTCNNINDPYSILCVPNVVKNINVKVFNLVSTTN